MGRYLFLNFIKLKAWDFSYNGLTIKDVSFVGNKPKVSAEVSITLINKSDFVAKIKDINIQVFSKEVRLGSVERPEELTIKAKGSSEVKFLINFNSDGLIDNWKLLAGTLLSTSNLPIDFVGQLKMNIAGIWTKVPIKYSTTGKDLKNMYETYYG